MEKWSSFSTGQTFHIKTAKNKEHFTGGSCAVGAVSRSHDVEVKTHTVFQIPQKSKTCVTNHFCPRVVDAVPAGKKVNPLVQSVLSFTEPIPLKGVASPVQHCEEFVSCEFGIVARVKIVCVDHNAFWFSGEQQIGCLHH